MMVCPEPVTCWHWMRPLYGLPTEVLTPVVASIVVVRITQPKIAPA